MRTMLSNQAIQEKRGLFRVLPLVGLALVVGSCVSQQEYNEAVDAAKEYQRALYDLERYQTELEAENRRIKAQLEVHSAGVSDAAFTEDIDQRLGQLQEIMAELGSHPGDVTKFRVDGGYVYRVKDSILFDSGSAQIRADAQPILDEIAADIVSRPHGGVFVRGHTDNVPIVKPATVERFPHGNLQLSASRAVEVAAQLIQRGKVASDRVTVMGFGPSDPVASNDTPEGRQQNRRVDIFVADE
jgi:flagellar motor protein MotB